MRRTFKPNVQDSEYTYKITKANSQNVEIGHEVSVIAGDEDKAVGKLATELGMTISETHESAVMIKHKISDENLHSAAI